MVHKNGNVNNVQAMFGTNLARERCERSEFVTVEVFVDVFAIVLCRITSCGAIP